MLSNDEIKTAQRLITQYRRFAMQWKVFRWVTLLLAFFMLGLTAFGYYQMEKLAAFNTSAQLALDPVKVAENIGMVLDARISLLRTELRMYSGLIVSGSIGGVLLWMALYGWNRQCSVMLLKAKLLLRAAAVAGGEMDRDLSKSSAHRIRKTARPCQRRRPAGRHPRAAGTQARQRRERDRPAGQKPERFHRNRT